MSVAQVSHAAINFSKKEMPFRILNAFRYTLGFIPFKVTCNHFMHCSKFGCAHVRRQTTTPSISLPFFIFFIAPAIIVRGASKSYILTLREEKRTKPVRLRTQREKASSGRKRTT